MKLSELITILEEVLEREGDVPVMVGEVSGVLRNTVQVHAEDVEMEESSETVVVVQALVVHH